MRILKISQMLQISLLSLIAFFTLDGFAAKSATLSTLIYNQSTTQTYYFRIWAPSCVSYSSKWESVPPSNNYLILAPFKSGCNLTGHYELDVSSQAEGPLLAQINVISTKGVRTINVLSPSSQISLNPQPTCDPTKTFCEVWLNNPSANKHLHQRNPR